MKKILKTVLVLVLVAIAFPIANLFVRPDNSGRLEALASDAKPVTAVLEERCVVCHTKGANLPFYAGFPIAKGMMEGDIDRGLAFLNWDAEAPDAEVALAKLEHVVELGTMPPGKYKLLHWDAGLSENEKDTILAWVRKVRAARYATGAAAAEHADSPLQPLVAPAVENASLVALGKQLFHDVRLSGDDTVSCASCHGLDEGGCDRLPHSKGIRGQEGGINAPTVFNAGANLAQFWDGRAADLADQAGGPVANPIEMGAEWSDVVGRLKQDGGYVAAFDAQYPDGLTRENVQEAIAAFEKTLVTTGSRFDQWLGGDEAALNQEERAGYDLFVQNACATCHVGETLGGQSFERMGRYGDYFADRGNPTAADDGRFHVTKDEADRHAFKVPTLRNIALTWPYFHDGTVTDLATAVRKMAQYQNGTTLSAQDTERVVAFLRTLTGDYEGKRLE